MFSVKRFAEYENGFGNVAKEYWMGLKKISALTANGRWELRVELVDFDGKKYFAGYDNFKVENRRPYKLRISGYQKRSTLENAFSGHNGMGFTTIDQDNDKCDCHCGILYGAWWYRHCHSSNLNGMNYNKRKSIVI